MAPREKGLRGSPRGARVAATAGPRDTCPREARHETQTSCRVERARRPRRREAPLRAAGAEAAQQQAAAAPAAPLLEAL